MIYSCDLLCIGDKKKNNHTVISIFLHHFRAFFFFPCFLFVNFFYSYYLWLPFIQDALYFPFRAASTDHFFMSGKIQLLLFYSNILLFLPCTILNDWHWLVFLAYQYCMSVLGDQAFRPSIDTVLYFSSFSSLISFCHCVSYLSFHRFCVGIFGYN